METIQQMTIGEMVTKYYRIAAVFQSFGISFCCKGKRTIEEVSEKIKINANEVWVEFEKDLHMHIHLENNILFPKSIQQEELYQIKEKFISA